MTAIARPLVADAMKDPQLAARGSLAEICDGATALAAVSLLAAGVTAASFEDVRRYQLHLATSGAGVPTLNQGGVKRLPVRYHAR